ncbi:hypothetical protein [Methanobrevibacter sp. UBA212]|uniref:hypothetical protein n=1 Tax=Methanobrevibacter sp. UBA212 TaxID=1915476 RepID=UPI0025ED15BF|nr:hypothetical protein [Methanobrevibacter sp. UBA212]
MGIVSASDDVSSDGNITADDYTVSDKDTSDVDEVIALDEREDDVEIIIHGYDREENSWENTKLDGEDYFAEIYASEDATGNLTVYVNGEECFKKGISECSQLLNDQGEYGYCIGPQDTNYAFDLGKYHVMVLYSGDEQYLPTYTSNTIRVVEKEYVSYGQDAVNIDIYGYNYDYGEWNDIALADDDYFAGIYAPDGITGNVTVFVNDTQCFKKDISDIDMYFDNDGYYEYCIALKDLDYEFSPGMYYINIVYDGNGFYSSASEHGPIKVVEESNNSDEVGIVIYGYDKEYNMWNNIELGSGDYFAAIYAPDDATGNVTVFVNGVQCFKEDISDCPQSTDSWDDLIYCIGLEDVDYEFSPGKYFVKIVYDRGGNSSQVIESDAINVVEEDYCDDGLEEIGVVIRADNIGLNGKDYFAVIHAPYDATGGIKVYVNGTLCLKDEIYALPEFIDDEGYLEYRIGPHDVNYEFFPGKYIVKIVYEGDETYESTSEKATINIVDVSHEGENPDDFKIVIYGYDKHMNRWMNIELDDNWFALLQVPYDAKGNVSIFVNGTRCFNKDVSKCRELFDDIDGHYEFFIYPRDVDYEFSVGKYSINIVYDGDDFYLPTAKSDIIRVVENGYDDGGRDAVDIIIRGGDSPKLNGEDYLAVIYAPDDATGNVTVFVNDVQCFKNDINKCHKFIDDDGCSAYCIRLQDIDYNLPLGKSSIKVVYDGSNFYSAASESNTLKIIDEKSGGNSNNGPSANPVSGSVKKDTVKLTLKKVKVKRSAKKLILQATLKINNKAKKGLKVTFKFNGKKFTAKTNKNGIAKVTIKKSVLKKLKIGKKVKIQVSYGKTTKNLIVKIKK